MECNNCTPVSENTVLIDLEVSSEILDNNIELDNVNNYVDTNIDNNVDTNVNNDINNNVDNSVDNSVDINVNNNNNNNNVDTNVNNNVDTNVDNNIDTNVDINVDVDTDTSEDEDDINHITNNINRQLLIKMQFNKKRPILFTMQYIIFLLLVKVVSPWYYPLLIVSMMLSSADMIIRSPTLECVLIFSAAVAYTINDIVFCVIMLFSAIHLYIKVDEPDCHYSIDCSADKHEHNE